MVRCFIGIFLPEKLKSKVASIQEELKKLPLDCKLVEESNLHISLSFLGEKSEEEISDIQKKMEEMGGMYKPFEVNVEKLKLIPTQKYVRVIAFDVRDEAGKLFSVSRLIETEIGGDAKPPHLTLCRVRKINDKQLFLEKIGSLMNTEIGSFTVSGISLIKSELRRQGPIYSVVSEATFSG